MPSPRRCRRSAVDVDRSTWSDPWTFEQLDRNNTATTKVTSRWRRGATVWLANSPSGPLSTVLCSGDTEDRDRVAEGGDGGGGHSGQGGGDDRQHGDGDEEPGIGDGAFG